MRIGWLLGWAVPEAWFSGLAAEAFPLAGHSFEGARPGAVGRLAEQGPFDWVAGYSLGSLLLLSEPELAARAGRRVALLSPIFAFPKEALDGGRISRAEIRLLSRRLGADRAAALRGFYSLSGLDAPADGAGEEADLRWGLERLEALAVPPRLPEGWRAWCGSEDRLLDAQRLREIEPRISVVAGAGHHPLALMRALAAQAGPDGAQEP